MPRTRIEIEEIGPGRWVAEVEAGGSSAVRRNVTGASFDDIVLAVVEAHAALTEPPAVKVPVMSVRELEAAQSERIGREVEAQAEAERVAADLAFTDAGAETVVSLDGLRDQAAALGIDVDRRWGERRLREEIERVTSNQRVGSDDLT